MPYRKKLLYSFFVLVILSMFIMISISSTSMMSAARHREIERIESGYTQSLLSVDNYIKRYINLAQVLKADSFLTNYLNKHYPQDTTLEKRYFDHISIMQTYTSRLLYETLNGNSVSVITDNQELFLMANSFISHCPPEIEAASWYQKSVQNREGCLLSEPVIHEGRSFVPLTLNLTPRSTRNNILVVYILMDNLNELLVIPERSQEYYLVDERGTVLASQNGELVGRALSETPCGFLQEFFSSADTENITIENNQTLYTMGRICRGNQLSACYLIEGTLMPSRSQTFFTSIRSCLPYWAIVLCADVFIILLIVGQFSNRMSQLMTSVHQLAEGESESLRILEGRDEFSSLSEYISEMVTKVQYFQKEAYQAKLDTKTAQIRALRSQINPHFLFNCLQAIQTSALKNGALETSDLIAMYSRMIRETITWTQETIPLAQELGLIQNYLAIQKIRLEEQLVYQLDVEETCKAAMMPKFTIQPIVENSIRYGMRGYSRPLSIVVRVCRIGDELELVVSDDGKGMDAQQLSSIRRTLEGDLFKDPPVQIGIANLHQRIRLRYGKAYGLRIESMQDCGTTVTIRLPFRLEPEQKPLSCTCKANDSYSP